MYSIHYTDIVLRPRLLFSFNVLENGEFDMSCCDVLRGRVSVKDYTELT